jgi:formylglycine-generating enzyme required for sulfatase activity/class 3 adenylate cyclase
MIRTSPYLEKKMVEARGYCDMQVVFVDIVSYSRRRSYKQVDVIHAFMKSVVDALNHTASQYVRYTQSADVQIRRDVVVLSSGDGAAIGFPFDAVRDMHLFFACELLRIVDKQNKELSCHTFQERGWCDCHDGFLLRCGISEGKVILYKDLNENFNIAGDTVNMAARVMDLADAGQVFLTQKAHSLIVDLIPDMERQFREYRQVQIKHDLRIDVYQFIDESRTGLDVSPRADLNLADVTPEPAIQNRSDEPTPVRTEDSYPSGLYGKQPDAAAPRDFVKDMRNRMIRVSGGEFLMGNEQTGRVLVEIPLPFLIDRYPIIQEDYMNIMGCNPSKFVGARLPVDNVSWLDAITFCNKLSELSGLKPAYGVSSKETTVDFGASGYRLPTEAEWEYCCRGGSQEDRYGLIDNVAWYNGNSERKTREVGQKVANGFGLYDMLGNVWEWCNDWYQRGYPKERQVNYAGPESGFQRVLRGGSWRDVPDCIRSSFRHRKNPLSSDSTHGMRVMLPWRE